MKDFSTCIRAIDESNKTTVKVAALKNYFDTAADEDKLWCIALLSHRRPKRPVTTTLLRQWAAEKSKIEDWLFEESYHIVGDLAETIAMLVSEKDSGNEVRRTLTDYIVLIQELKGKEVDYQKEVIWSVWAELDYFECFLFNKILTGGFRIGVSQKLMTRALSQSLGLPESQVAHRLMGNWTPDSTDFSSLLLEDDGLADASKPYPFYLSYQLEEGPFHLGDPNEWTAEWKWDGIRGQIIKRKDELFIWTRGEELVTDRYPELAVLSDYLPNGTVLDGELLPFADNSPMDFSYLQKRIGRKNVSKKLIQEIPVVFMAYDVLEYKGEDIRSQPFRGRRTKLDSLILDGPEVLHRSDRVEFKTWEELADKRKLSRKLRVEGLMLKSNSAEYKSGRVKGEVWKWKVDPYTVDAVLTYAMRGHGRRADLYTDYTFGLWDGEELVTFAKAYSGLTDAELKEVDRFVKKNTLNRFGPVREVAPELVFELAFEGLNKSTRHKSGVATRFPRIKRWRRDKPASEADSLKSVLKLIE